MNDFIKRASTFAIIAHEACGQVRKFTGEPYWWHLDRVASRVQSLGCDAETVAAAWLHDTLEDTFIKPFLISSHFTTHTRIMVEQLTNDKSLQRKERKADECERFKFAYPETQTVKLADILDNGYCFLRSGAHEATKTFMLEKQELLKSLDLGHPKLYEEAKQMIDNYTLERSTFYV